MRDKTGHSGKQSAGQNGTKPFRVVPSCPDDVPVPCPVTTLGVERHGRSLWLCAVGHASSIKLARFSSWREVDEFQRALHLRDMMMHEKGRMGF